MGTPDHETYAFSLWNAAGNIPTQIGQIDPQYAHQYGAVMRIDNVGWNDPRMVWIPWYKGASTFRLVQVPRSAGL